MDRYLFRGKNAETDDAEWVYGFYQEQNNHCFIWHTNTKTIVISETVGQWTGLRDKWEQMIFEGDKIRIHDKYDYTEGVKYNNGYYYTCKDGLRVKLSEFTSDEFSEIEVIGNIYEQDVA